MPGRPIQELPPPGGYAKIVYERVPAKAIPGLLLAAGLIGAHFVACGIRKFYTNVKIRNEHYESTSAHIVLSPFFFAEKDRAKLLMLRKSRDAEAELMKDVEGWELGTWNGEPVFKTIAQDEWVEPLITDYLAHSPPHQLKEIQASSWRKWSISHYFQ